MDASHTDPVKRTSPGEGDVLVGQECDGCQKRQQCLLH